MKKKVFFKTVLLMLVSSLMLMGCSHSSSGSDHYLFPDGEGGYTEYNYIGGIEEAVSYIGELTDEGTYVVKVIDTSETSCSSLKEALDSLREGVLVCLDLSETSIKIGSSEFKECENLSGIALSKTLKEVGSYAFYDCINLKEVYIPDSVTRIGSFAFAAEDYSNKNKLKTVTLPKNLKVIEDFTFYDCYNLETVYLPDTLEYIGECAFCWCESLTTLTKDGDNTLPKSLKSMGSDAFYNCHALEKIDLSETQLKEIPGSAFSSSALATVYLPNTIKSIGDCAFYDCESLEIVYLPETLESIGRRAFCMSGRLNDSMVIWNGSIKIIIEKESGKAWGYASNTGSSGESNSSATNLKMIPCFEENVTYFLVGTGELQCGTSCCQDGNGICCSGREGNTCACTELTNDINTDETCGYSYYWYKVAYSDEEE